MKTINYNNTSFIALSYRDMISINGGKANIDEAWNSGYAFGQWVRKILDGATFWK